MTTCPTCGQCLPVEWRHVLTVTVPIRTVSEANTREHWAKKAARHKAQRGGTYLMVSSRLPKQKPKGKIRVTITRIAPRKLDGDNLAISCKHVRDGVSDALSLADDRESDYLEWVTTQERGKYAVRITIEEQCT